MIAEHQATALAQHLGDERASRASEGHHPVAAELLQPLQAAALEPLARDHTEGASLGVDRAALVDQAEVGRAGLDRQPQHPAAAGRPDG